jgi:hypothetical protein
MDVDRKRTVLALAVLDSGDYSRSGGYGSPSDAALHFLDLMPGVLHTRMMVFQHFPLPQYYRLLKSVPPNAAHAVEGYRVFSGHHYVLNEDNTLPGSYLGEGISCPDADSGEYAILAKDRRYLPLPRGMIIVTVSLAKSMICCWSHPPPADSGHTVRLRRGSLRDYSSLISATRIIRVRSCSNSAIWSVNPTRIRPTRSRFPARRTSWANP